MISVDFTELYRQIERLNKFLNSINETVERIDEVIRSLSQMELGETLDELYIIKRRLSDSVDDTQRDINKLKKIILLYIECETEIAGNIDNLPVNFPNYSEMNFMFTAGHTAPRIGFMLKTNSFENRSIINEEWLNNLIY